MGNGTTLHSGNLGMTLRDWFAGQALAGLCVAPTNDLSEVAYRLADEMMTERSKARGQ